MVFDENLPADVQSVLNATALLDITEFQFFQLAYLRWFGRQGTDQKIEVAFTSYMFQSLVPSWVRYLARHVEDCASRDCLDPNAVGVQRLPHSRHMVHKGIRYAIILALVLSGLIVFVNTMVRLSGLSKLCMFPPCY